MGGYQPLFIAGNASGLVQNRQNFLLPNDAYPTLINMFLFREQLRRRQGVQFLGRLQLDYTEINYLVFGTAPYSQIFLNVSGYVAGADNSNPGIVTTTYAHGLSTGDGIIFTGIEGAIGYNAIEFFITVLTDTTFNIGVDATAFGSYTTGGTWISNRSLHSQSQNADAQVVPGSFILTSAGVTFTDDGAGNLSSSTPGNTGTINYGTGTFSILTTTVSVGSSAVISYSYYPLLPVMGIRTEEVAAIDDEPTIVFDTQYAYQIVSGVISGLPSVLGVQWTGNNANFFFSTNWWVDSDNNKLFWVTNFSGQGGDPIRYYNTVTWTDFAPVINASNDVLGQCLAMVPFRGRLVVFNTIEGQTLASGVNFYQRIRWSAIGSPLLSNAWRDDIRGQGGFLDIPTSENITAIGFIRDSLVVFCERSTWQLRYTGRSISPFQIEKVNPELGAYSAFSSVQFDTSLVGIGDKGIVECDSYKAVRIDAKIPDLVFRMSNSNSAPQRIQGIRDIQQRLAYWTYVDQDASQTQIADGGDGVYPNRRLVYNYENDSWAIFTDSITSMGTYQPSEGIKWQDATDITWSDANFPWVNRENLFPALLGGNQQGFLFYLGSNLTPQVSNQQTLAITAITPSSTLPVLITAPNHNMVNGQVIQINGIPDK